MPQGPHLSGDSRGWLLHSLSRMAIADSEVLVETSREANQGSQTHLPLPWAMASSLLLCSAIGVLARGGRGYLGAEGDEFGLPVLVELGRGRLGRKREGDTTQVVMASEPLMRIGNAQASRSKVTVTHIACLLEETCVETIKEAPWTRPWTSSSGQPRQSSVGRRRRRPGPRPHAHAATPHLPPPAWARLRRVHATARAYSRHLGPAVDAP